MIDSRTNDRNSQTEGRLSGRKVAILATDGVERLELQMPREALIAAGAQVDVIAPEGKAKIHSFDFDDPAEDIPTDISLDDVESDQYDALVLPGGVANPDKLRVMDEAIDFIRSFVQSGRPIAAICHGPWTLIDAGGVSGKKMTSWPSLKSDLRNAGAQWVDESVVRDDQLVTSRKPDDLKDFNREMIEIIASFQGSKSQTPHQIAQGANKTDLGRSTDSAAPGAQI